MKITEIGQRQEKIRKQTPEEVVARQAFLMRQVDRGKGGVGSMGWITKIILKRYRRKLESEILTQRYDTEVSRKLECVQHLLDRK